MNIKYEKNNIRKSCNQRDKYGNIRKEINIVFTSDNSESQKTVGKGSKV